MGTYVWDLGFDCNAFQNPHRSNQIYLQNGFVSLLSNGTMPAFPVNLETETSPRKLPGNPGDFVGFNVFNLTNGASLSSHGLVSATIDIIDAASGQPSSPFGGPISITPIGQQPLQANHTSTSAIFSGGQGTVFPSWVLAPATALANNGMFLITIQLRVQSLTVPGAEPLTFVVDPEMVVGSIG
jgi:hypothetical protein